MTVPPPKDQAGYSLGFYARQPVFDPKGSTWAYSIYFRNGQHSALPPEARADGATQNVLAALLGEGGGKRRLVKFAAESLIHELPLLLPKETLVVEVHEDLCGDPQGLDAVRKLKARGYALAVSHFSGREAAAGLHALADVLWVDALQHDRAELARLAAACQGLPGTPGLMRIEDKAVYELGKELGFKLFQGHFFQQPETVCTRKLSSSQFSRLKLLQAIEQENPDFKALAETIRADVALSYKLFGLLNSAFFSFPCQVLSVKQALSLLGWESLRTWIRLVILTDLTPAGKVSELPRSATLRGRFLELAAKSLEDPPVPRPDGLFLVGLFSLLPALLDTPMAEILACVRLPAEVAPALLEPGHPAAVWLALAVAFERADWPAVQEAIALLQLSPMAVAQAYTQALDWTDAIFRSVPA